MSRLGFLLSLLSFLFVSSSASDVVNVSLTPTPAALGAGYKSAGWTQVTRAAQFSGRAGGVVEWYTGNVWVGSRYQPGSWLLMYGSGIWTCYDDCTAKEEIWASANKGKTWTQIQPVSPYNPLMSPQTVQDSRGYQYRIQGTDYTHGCDGSVYGDVWMSTDGGYKWVMQSDIPSATGRFLGTAVADSANNIYVIHGQACNPSNGFDYPLNDVWMSATQGKTWRNVRQSTTKAPPARSVHGSVVGKYYDPSTTAAVDAIYVMYGWRGYGEGLGNLYRNDVWVSTSGTSTWVQITEKASWTARGDSQLEITSKGVMVLAGGVSNIEGTERRELNDVWASLDGGYTWGICSDNARWDDRQFQYTAIDNEGYLYVIGGRATDPSGSQYLANDVWTSAQSFDDIDSVASMCGLVVPPCGVGLRCLPSDNNFYQGVWGVSCDACAWSPSSAGSGGSAANMTMTYLFVAFLLATIALAAALGYLVYRMKQSGASSPIPLPGSAQRWWNDKPSEGLSEGLTKDNTASDADTMYNPLTIRDQM